MLYRILPVVMAVWLAALSASAHDGHDHDAPPTLVSTTIAPRIDASSTTFELIAVFRNSALTIFVDRFVTNEPVTGAQVEVDTPKGTVTATENSDGSYMLPADWASSGGSYDLIFTVTAGNDIDVLTGTLKIPVIETPAPVVVRTSWLVANAVASGVRERIASYDPTLPAVGIVAFLAGAVLMRWRRSDVNSTGAIVLAFAVLTGVSDAKSDTTPANTSASNQSAVDLAQRFPDGAVFVPKTTQRILAVRTIMAKPEEHRRSIALAGRVMPDPSASGSVQTSVTGRLSPPPGGFPRLGQRVKAGDALALVQPAISSADITAQQQQARELEQQITLVQRRLERLRPIANVVARSQIEDAELEIAGLRNRKTNLERAQKREPEVLIAPVDGVIASAAATAGQVVEVNAMIFQIVNPDRLWIEALTFDAVAGARSASARLNDGRVLKLEYRGTGFADRSQAIPIHFAVDEGARGLRMGQLMTVLAETEETKTGIAVPRTAVVRAGNGQMIVYEHANAERFVAREVRVEPLDAERVLVISGLDSGKRIVTQGVELLNQIR